MNIEIMSGLVDYLAKAAGYSGLEDLAKRGGLRDGRRKRDMIFMYMYLVNYKEFLGQDAADIMMRTRQRMSAAKCRLEERMKLPIGKETVSQWEEFKIKMEEAQDVIKVQVEASMERQVRLSTFRKNISI